MVISWAVLSLSLGEEPSAWEEGPREPMGKENETDGSHPVIQV